MASESDHGSEDKPESGRANGRFSGQRVTPQSPNEALQPEAAPPPPPIPPSRRRPALSALSGFLTFLLLLAVAAVFGVVWSQQRLREPGPLAADKVLYITPGAEVADIIAELDREGVIDSPVSLNLALLIEGNRSKVKAGEYLFKQSASLRDVIDTLVSGKQVLHAITIPEGLTSEQIVERLRENDVLLGEVKDLPKEGSLLPETYKVARGTSRSDVVKKMQDDQKRVVDQIWARRAADLPLRSPYELVILASIVEKETGKADERPRVAGVFINRLLRRMRLQSDPTIVYGLVGGKGTLGRGITRAELEKPTPYNTYAIDGLPQGPIANPGRAALDAVANPSRTQELYFVADGTGGHVFAETLDQHARNVQKWRQIEKDAKDKAEKPASDIDKSTPAVVPAPAGRGDQRGAIGGASVYGSLSRPSEAAAAPGLGAAASAIAAVAPAADESRSPAGRAANGKKQAKGGGEKHGSPLSAFTMGPGLEELGITVRGLQPSPASLDGPIGPSELADEPPAPAAPPARRMAEQSARTDRADPSWANNDQLLEVDVAPPQQGPVARASRFRSLDASEGKPFDPLLDKTYDLNYAKTVPAMK
ncbi:endolytic transglycosylase MltG [Methylocapsa acidiphila]|uniref:endolytic transglycosylase MltG n=1 Tax=Methylocapsa acidiphila TaxID=133552 RepID=UPI0004157DEE|nr:endolytic transglycosylase MltG [Methylocapsa acidiphila]